MKKFFVLFAALAMVLSSCNLDSPTGIFEQIYSESEKNNVTVRFLAGAHDGEYYFATKENGIAVSSSPYSGYSRLGSVSKFYLSFIAENADGKGYGVGQDASGNYLLLDFDTKKTDALNIKVGGNEATIAASYYNATASGSELTLLLNVGNDFFLYVGSQPTVSDSTISLTDSKKIEIGENGYVPQIIGPGKYTLVKEDGQASWTINGLETSYKSRPVLCIGNLVMLANGQVFNGPEDTKTDIGDLSDYLGERIVAAGYGQDGSTIYGITDGCTFKFADGEFTYNSVSSNSIYIAMLESCGKVATTENGIQNYTAK